MLLTSKVAYNSYTSTTQKMIKINKGWMAVDRQIHLFYISQTILAETGLLDQKQIYLFTQWRPLLPVDCQDITCPRPSDDVVQQNKNMVKEKRQSKEALQTNKQTRKGNKSAYNARKHHTARKTALPNYLSDEYNFSPKNEL